MMSVLINVRRVLLAVMALSLWPAQAQASHFNFNIYDQDRYYWDLYSYYWYISNGTIDSFDAWARSTINGSDYRSDSYPYYYREFANRGMRSSQNRRYGNFEVQGRVYVPASGHVDSRNYMRMIWNIRNTSGSPQNLNFRIYGNLGSDGSTRITRTSDGNTSWATSDTWLATDDYSNGGGDPSLSFIYSNAGGRAPSAVRRSGDNLYIDWNNVRVAGNTTVTFMLYTAQNRNQSASHAEATRIVTLPTEVLANLTTDEKRRLVNFGMGAAVQNLAFTVSNNTTPVLRATWTLSDRATARAQLYENSRIAQGQTACSGGTLISTQNLAANTRFSYSWTNTANWNRLKRGTSYCVKVTATDSGNNNASRAVTLNSAIGSMSSDIDQYAPSIRATARFNAQAGYQTYMDLYPTANCTGNRSQRTNVAWNATSHTANFSGNAVQRNTSYCVKVINGFASRNFTVGTVSAQPRDYPTSLDYILGRLRAVDGDGEDFEDDLNDAINHVTVAKAYWDARTDEGANEDFNDVAINWGPSFRRAIRSIDAMSSARRNDAPRALKTYETDLAAAILQQVKVHANTTLAGRIDDETPDYWATIRTNGVNAVNDAREEASGRAKAAAAASAYDKLGAMYDSRYSAENRVSQTQIAIDALIDEELDDRPRDELVAALNNTVRYALKYEIKAARETSTAGRTQLDAVLTSINQVSTCMGALQSQGLTDHDFTECYIEVVKIVKKLREVQGALVDTYTWRALLGIGVYGMLDISINHSTNSLVTQEGVDEDEEAQTGISEYRSGLVDLRAGRVKIALQRYINNECRIINLYNRYWAGPGNPVIDGTDACARVCGNSRVEEGEQCDDGNFTDTDGCTTNCQNNVCGDGTLYRGREACDDGNQINTDACTNACAVARCGDQVVRAGVEECDDGNQVNDDNCTNECASARCGDGIQQGTEQCDDGNENNDDSCSNTCRSSSVKMATGYYHSCFVKAGRVYCVGYGPQGQMGNGTNTSQNTSLQTVRNLTDVTDIATGNYHNCALKSNGTVWCWGYNAMGQLGDNSTTQRNTPVQVRGLTDATQVTAGAYHSCALRSGGGVKCWGYNPYGNLGDGSNSQRRTPVDVRGISSATQISAGYYHTCARLSNSQLKCWGYGQYHQVTNTSNRNSRNTPVTVSGASAEEVNATAWGTCYRRNNGTVGCFGYGCHGQMGDGRTSCYNYGNRTVSGITNAVQLGGGYYHNCARLQTGQIKCWGYNPYGALGDGSTSNRSTPVAVQGISNSTNISRGPSSWHTCSSNSDGTTKCWGRGSYGALGTGNTSNRNTPQTLGGVLAANQGGGGGGNTNLNSDLGTIAHCGYGQARRSAGARLERVGIYNSRNSPLQRNNDHANWDSFCRANGWEASNSGRGNSNHACAQVMTYWSAGGVSEGRGSWRSGNYTPNRGAGSHIYMTCIGGQDNLNVGAGRLNLGTRHRLSTQFSGGHSNFHPQGMCYDNTRNQLVFAHQGSRRALTKAAVTGTPIREAGRVSTALHHTTSVACDSSQYYLADYTGNASYQDMYTLSLTGSRQNFWSARAGYGGFPIAVYGADMFRTALSTTYNWNNLTRIYRTNKANPSSVRNNFAAPGPVGDMCHDGTRLWALRYVHNRESTQVSLWGFNPSNGTRSQTYNNITQCTRGQPKGLGCNRGANKLYVWCYEENSNTEGEIIEFNIGR